MKIGTHRRTLLFLYLDSIILFISPTLTIEHYNYRWYNYLDKLEFFEHQSIFFQKGIDSHAPS